MTPNDGRVRDPQTGGLLTVANQDTNARVAAVAPSSRFVLPPWFAGALGLLTLLCAAPAAAVTTMLASGHVPPVWLITAAAIGTPLGGVLNAGAYWAAGGNPLDILARFAPKVPPSPSSAPEPSPPSSGKGPPLP